MTEQDLPDDLPEPTSFLVVAEIDAARLVNMTPDDLALILTPLTKDGQNYYRASELAEIQVYQFARNLPVEEPRPDESSPQEKGG